MGNYKIKTIGLIILAAALISSTQTRWYGNLVQKVNEDKQEKKIKELENSIISNMDLYLPSAPRSKFIQDTMKIRKGANGETIIETFCPEHLKWDYIPPTQDPNVIYFWNRTNETKRIKDRELYDEEIERIS